MAWPVASCALVVRLFLFGRFNLLVEHAVPVDMHACHDLICVSLFLGGMPIFQGWLSLRLVWEFYFNFPGFIRFLCFLIFCIAPDFVKSAINFPCREVSGRSPRGCGLLGVRCKWWCSASLIACR